MEGMNCMEQKVKQQLAEESLSLWLNEKQGHWLNHEFAKGFHITRISESN